MIPTFDSASELQNWVLSYALKHGHRVSPRGLHTLEVSPFGFALRHARRRCITHPQRRWSLPLALGEFSWHFSGSNDLHFIEYYARGWRHLTGGSSTIVGSCYGHRIFVRHRDRPSQWERVVKLLESDAATRRAVLNLSDPDLGLDGDATDVPCASTLQFLVRSGSLSLIVNMRSNDAILGLPYDLFFFTMLQEFLACKLGLELGTYYHFVGSMHLYERHIELAKRMVSEEAGSCHFEMPPMQRCQEVRYFLEIEARLRTDPDFILGEVPALHPYWRNLGGVLEWYRFTKSASSYREVADFIPRDSPYATLLHNMAAQEGIREGAS